LYRATRASESCSITWGFSFGEIAQMTNDKMEIMIILLLFMVGLLFKNIINLYKMGLKIKLNIKELIDFHNCEVRFTVEFYHQQLFFVSLRAAGLPGTSCNKKFHEVIRRFTKTCSTESYKL
jgi:hypothetical protein